MARRLKFEDVKQYFKDHDCELLETEYINSKTKMRYRCKCGNKKCKICFDHFKNGRRCIKCGGKEKFTFDYVSNYFKERGCKLLATKYINNSTPMEYECNCGNKKCKICFDSFKNGNRCMKCGIKRRSDKKRLDFKEVKQYFEDHNCELLETEYINNTTKMRYRCDCGNEKCKITFNRFQQGGRCKKCGLKKHSGKNHPNYNPNLTDEEREKGRICPGLRKWRKLILERDNNTCQYCFQTDKKLIAHHIENYANNKELRTVLSNGFLFCEEHHIEFHKEYGYNCNREQLEDFLNSKIKINY